MPPLNLAKKLKPARKAWKSFTIKLRSRLESFNVSSSIKSSTHRFLDFFSFHLLAPFKKRFLSKQQASGLRRSRFNYYDQLYTYQQYQNQPNNNNRKVIYIDQLYGEPMSSSSSSSMQVKHNKELHAPHAAETSRRNEEESGGGGGGVYSIEDAWKAVVAKSPHLRGVDERADEFIYKFREERQLEKERSDIDFQEMLARSA